MSVHVGEFKSEITVTDGDLPLSPAQFDQLVKRVKQELAKEKRAATQAREAAALVSGVGPKLDVG